MGALFAKLYYYWAIQGKEFRILMIGLDGAGKTTVLQQMKYGEQAATVPTVGFNFEAVKFNGVVFNAWDVGGQQQIRKLWQHYLSGNHAVIYIIDSADVNRHSDALEELAKIHQAPDVSSVPYLILANKQDLPGAYTAEQIDRMIKVIFKQHQVYKVFPIIATENEGIIEGLLWLYDELIKSC
jgi:small GTP-binding protein